MQNNFDWLDRGFHPNFHRPLCLYLKSPPNRIQLTRYSIIVTTSDVNNYFDLFPLLSPSTLLCFLLSFVVVCVSVIVFCFAPLWPHSPLVHTPIEVSLTPENAMQSHGRVLSALCMWLCHSPPFYRTVVLVPLSLPSGFFSARLLSSHLTPSRCCLSRFAPSLARPVPLESLSVTSFMSHQSRRYRQRESSQ